MDTGSLTDSQIGSERACGYTLEYFWCGFPQEIISRCLYVMVMWFAYCNLIGAHCTVREDSGYVPKRPDPLLLSEWV